MADLKCGYCGDPLPLSIPEGSEIITCRKCGAKSRVEQGMYSKGEPITREEILAAMFPQRKAPTENDNWLPGFFDALQKS